MKSPSDGHKKMNKNGANNGNGSIIDLEKAKLFSSESEDAKLKFLLQKAVRREAAPESLRDSIRKMIRQ